MNGRALRTAFLLAAAGLALSGCGEKAIERSFTDRHGRVCTYVMVEDWEGDKDVGNISCEFPRSPAPSPPSTPSPSPS
ncbi:hypothetical protein DPM19_21345 [Actinomadura craniellae]|uniref:Uncharacterized protein n=1 Tax=Actinomadura craniellae TaxID=2231787 RepID=A0A365H232_9ACTN|nr:hypothetical protein [Actinomadura craniellae]RAY13052.1 hypothetical protein DPM19_21345 [Actinomadura craniellae]